MKWEAKGDLYTWGLTVGVMMGIAFWMLFDDPIFGFLMGICMAVIFGESGRTKHYAEVDGRVLRFGRKGHEKHELLLDDVSSITFRHGAMVVNRDEDTLELDGASDEEGLQKFVEELQPQLERSGL